MLSLESQNRVDLLFSHFLSKDAALVEHPDVVAEYIFAVLQLDCEGLSLRQVRKRVGLLVHRAGSVSIHFEVDRGGRPRKWHGRLRQIRVPEQFADALLEIALEWQQNSLAKIST